MEKSMLVRLKPHDPKKGLLLKQYTYQGIRFQAGRGWYRVDGEVAAYLEEVHSVPGDEDTPLAFEVCTPDEARALDEKDRKAARQVLPAEEALDVSHVGGEQSRAKSRPSPDRDDAPRRQRRDSDRLPENAQADAADDEDVEDEAPRSRSPRHRAGVVSRRPRAVVEDFDDSDHPEGDAFEDEAPRRRAPRRRSGVVSRRPRAVVEDFDESDDEFDDENEAFEDEDEAFEDEAPRRRARRGRAGAMARRRPHADDVGEFDDEELDDEVDEFDEFEEDELDEEYEDDTEDAAPPRRRRSLPLRSRASRARRIQRYAVEHDALDDHDRLTRRVRGPRQAEALDALRIREARRTRQRVAEDAVGSERDDEPTQKLPRSRSQGRQGQDQDELHIRHARQMAAKLEEIDALDDAMSYGDAEDSLPNEARRNRHGGHGDAEDSLPTTRSKHVSQRDAEDSLPDEATRYGDAEDSLPARNRHNGQGDAEDSLSMRSRHSYGDAEDSLPRCDRRKQQDAPSSRHTADAQDDLDAVDQEPDRRNVEEPARSDARSQRAQQPPSSAAHDELDALDDALDDDLDKASEDQRPGSAQPQHGQQRTGSSQQRHPEGAHDATSGAVSRDERQPWPDDDPFVNRDTGHQEPASGHEPVAGASASPRQGRRIYVPGPNTRASESAVRSSGENRTAPQRWPPGQPQPNSRQGDVSSPADRAPEAQASRPRPGRQRRNV
jgi:hypothetical protein